MAGLDAAAVAKLLVEFGRRMELAGENPYRARAYTKAAEGLRGLTEPLDKLVAQGRLREIPGVGEGIAERIKSLQRTGTHPKLETLRGQIPAGVLEMLNLPGLRADRVLKIHKELGIESLDALEQAARADKLKGVKGLGPALQRKILEGLKILRDGQGRRHVHRAGQLLEAAQANLQKSHPELRRVTPAGEYRRGCEVVGELSLVAEVKGSKAAPRSPKVGGQIQLHVADPAHYGATLLFATGSTEHVQALQKLAEKKGLTLEATGLRRGARAIACKDEKSVYAALGLPFIPPELREGRREIEWAAAKKLPKLVSDADIRGILHAHTDLSDGVHDLQQMADATRKRGYSYFGVADHSQSAGYAGGLSQEEIAGQHAEIDRLNKKCTGKFHIFKGIESDILRDGSLDYPDEVLQKFDFVVASVHSQFRLDQETQTARILRAVENPYTTMLGHLTGRQLLRRHGYNVDVDAILQACAGQGVVVEVNSNPYRLELDWRWHQRALELGCMLSINPDAHSTSEIDLTHWGVQIARKGGVPKERVLNCLELSAFSKFLQERKRARVPARRITSAAKPAKPAPLSTRRRADAGRAPGS
jgi:DNA polymerase (family 10)